MRTRLLPATMTMSLCLGWALAAAAQVAVEVNKPRSIFDCDTKVAEDWYGSRERCLEDLCAGESVTRRYVRDDRGQRRLRKNPCYGLKPR